jgi:hypothetical protein
MIRDLPVKDSAGINYFSKKAEKKADHDSNHLTRTTFRTLNRKLHIYTGLYFLLFIWLFSLSGLLLNNPEWSVSNYWPDRQVTDFQRQIIQPPENGDLAIAKNLMSQLAIRGEIHETGWGDSENELHLQVRRPGQLLVIEANFEKNLADLTETQVAVYFFYSGLRFFYDQGSNRGLSACTLLYLSCCLGVPSDALRS